MAEVVQERDRELSLITNERRPRLARSNVLISSRFKSSLLENKLLNLSIYSVQKGKNGLTATFTTSQLRDILGLKNSSNIYQQIRDASDALTDHKFILDDPKNKRFLIANLVTTAAYNNGELKVVFNERVMPYITNLKSNFTTTRLSILLSFGNNKSHATRNNYSMRIYELLQQFAYCLTPDHPEHSVRYTLSDLKFSIGIVDVDSPEVRKALNAGMSSDDIVDRYTEKSMFSRWTDFKNRCLIPAQKEINEKTDLMVTDIEPVRSGLGGKVTSVVFHIKNNPNYLSEEIEAPVMKADINLVAQVGTMIPELNVPAIMKLLSVAGNDVARIEKSYRLSRKYKNIHNLEAWLIKAVQEGWEAESVQDGGSSDMRYIRALELDDLLEEQLNKAVGKDSRKKTRKDKSQTIAANDFEQREYDYEALERALLAARGAEY